MRECSPPTTCHMSHIECHVSHVMCHVSHVTCHFFFWQIAETCRWRVCYQQGLPRLVFIILVVLFSLGWFPFWPHLQITFRPALKISTGHTNTIFIIIFILSDEYKMFTPLNQKKHLDALNVMKKPSTLWDI